MDGDGRCYHRGRILTDLFTVLVLGMCFFAGGLRFSEQAFESSMWPALYFYEWSDVDLFWTATTQIHSSLLSISVGAVLLPAAYHFSLSGGEGLASNEQKRDILQMSHGVSDLQSKHAHLNSIGFHATF